MSKTKSRDKIAKVARGNKGRWSVLVLEAEEKVKQAKRRVTELELALETFRRHEREGTPWPIEESATQN